MNDLIQFWTEHTPIFSILIPAITAFYFGVIGQSWIRFFSTRLATTLASRHQLYLWPVGLIYSDQLSDLCQLRANQCL
jgi:hypothetical protein